jgi:starch synthase
MVSRLVEQKGVDFTVEAVERLLNETDAQFVVLGTGNEEFEDAFAALEKRFPGRVKALLKFDEHLARLIYGGSDAFLMPSRFEPCGMGQLMAMRYGTLPIARRTGGLADTINDEHDKTRVGFLFDEPNAESFYGAIQRAWDRYKRQPGYWQIMQKRAMILDFSWNQSAQHYLDLYRQTIVSVTEGVPN